MGARGIDERHVSLDGRQARLLDGVGVQIGRVVIADLLFDGAGRVFLGGDILDDRADVLFSLARQFIPRAPAGPVGGDLDRLQPAPIGIAEEIITGLH
jgi:hypothetical protein